MVLLHCLTLLVLPMEVRDWLHKAGLAFKPDGTGTATSQDESSGTTVQAGTAITVHFRR